MTKILARIGLILGFVLLAAPAAQAQFNILPEIRGGFFARGVDGGGTCSIPTA